MAIINILDKHTQELIAAGEVVERPASVVKELVENSIDAGAKNVSVHIEKGGIALIQISDDGCGIEREYIQTAFIRHATSKIKNERDLESIGTLGFRGEALASIASVARVELLTKTQSDEFASLFEINGGEECEVEVAARPVGTTITVRDLFYNTPARLKFLKKDASEANFISDIIIQQALSHPEVAFKFYKDNKLQFQSLGDGNVKSAAYSVLSQDFAKDLINVDSEDNHYSVKGYVTSPLSARKSRGMQFFFVNGRYIKNTTMCAALEAAYKGMVMHGKFPGALLFLHMPAELVDVNVHPAKTQVRFANERDVFSAVYKAVKCAVLPGSCKDSAEATAPADVLVENLGQMQIQEQAKTSASTAQDVYVQGISENSSQQVGEEEAPQVKAETPQRRFTPVTAMPSTVYADDIEPIAIDINDEMGETLATDPQVPYKATNQSLAMAFAAKYANSEEESAENETLGEEAVHQNTEKSIENENENENERENECENEQIAQTAMFENNDDIAQKTLKYIGEVFNTYIITQTDTEMCIIDKHAAHERLLYEKLVANYKNVSSQILLHPVTVTLSANEKNALLQNEQILRDSGVEIDDFGVNSVILRAVPADIEQTDLENFVVELGDKLTNNPNSAITDKTQWVLHSISCKAAIKGGQKNFDEELFALAREIIYGDAPLFCPHGRPVIIRMTKKEVEKQFGRQG